MAVKVGNSWVSEAALSYAKVKADSGESATLNGLLDRYPGVNFSTNTQAFSQKGTNNIQIAPIILAQMQNNPDNTAPVRRKSDLRNEYQNCRQCSPQKIYQIRGNNVGKLSGKPAQPPCPHQNKHLLVIHKRGITKQ